MSNLLRYFRCVWSRCSWRIAERKARSVQTGSSWKGLQILFFLGDNPRRNISKSLYILHMPRGLCWHRHRHVWVWHYRYYLLYVCYATSCVYWDQILGKFDTLHNWHLCPIIRGTLFGCVLMNFLFQTILHAASVILSIGAFYFYSLLYNSLCVNCFGLPSTYWIIQKAMLRPTYWLVTLLSCVAAVLPR